MKTLFITTRSELNIIIPSEVYCQGSKEKGFTYHRRVNEIELFIEDRQDGYLNGKVTKNYLPPDDIIRLADEIKAIRANPATKEEMPYDPYNF